MGVSACQLFSLGVIAGLIASLGVVHQMIQKNASTTLRPKRLHGNTGLLYAMKTDSEYDEEREGAAGEGDDGPVGIYDTERRDQNDDEDWSKKNCTVQELINPDQLYKYIYDRQLHCDKPVMVGGQLETHPPYMVGEKWVCMSKQFDIVPGLCLALSFGIEWDFSFDDDLDKRFNCKVYSFDPTIKKKAHQRSSNIMFYDLGLSDKDTAEARGKMARYITILKMLGLENSTIDYLKIDIEGHELKFFEDVFTNTPNLLKNVKMIGMEVHAGPNPTMEVRQKLLWKYFQLLDCFGFKVMFREINPVHKLRFLLRGHMRSCCYEVVWARDKHW